MVPRNRAGDACTNETRAATSGAGGEGKGPMAPCLKQTVKRSNFCNCVHFFDKHEVFIALMIFLGGLRLQEDFGLQIVLQFLETFCFNTPRFN